MHREYYKMKFSKQEKENSKIAEHGEVLTFRQAAKEYPDHYKF